MTVDIRLGYGCSSLMGRISRRECLHILGEAFESGISHFDVARSYGYGRAESVLGEFSQGKRDKVFIATKAGFTAMPPKFYLQAARWFLKPVSTLVPAIRPLLRRKAAAALVSRPLLSASSLRTSLETSLRELRTNFVDVLLLHEATAEELADENLLKTLDEFVAEGKVRRYGVGSDLSKIPGILAMERGYLQVLQLENNPGVRAFDRFDLAGISLVITHRAVGALGEKICRAVVQNPSQAARWSELTGADVKSREQLSALLLAYSLAKNPGGKVLFSTLHAGHLRANAATAGQLKKYEPRQFDELERIVASLPAAEA